MEHEGRANLYRLTVNPKNDSGTSKAYDVCINAFTAADALTQLNLRLTRGIPINGEFEIISITPSNY